MSTKIELISEALTAAQAYRKRTGCDAEAALNYACGWLASALKISAAAARHLLPTSARGGSRAVDVDRQRDLKMNLRDDDSTPTVTEPEEGETMTTGKKRAKKAAKKTPTRPRKAVAVASKTPTPKKGKGVAAKTNGTRRATAEGPRAKTIQALVIELFKGGKDLEHVVTAVQKAFPKEASTSAKHVSWYRWHAKKKGWLT